jgi:hypothetical protein
LRSDPHDLDERRELRVGRASAAIFLTLLLAAVYFHQGGGWNQNARFNQIRAIVETGSLAIDDYLLYGLERDERGAIRYRRVRLSDPATRVQRMPRVNGLDVSFHGGHYYPNKPPGMVFLGVPIYFAAHRVEGWLGVDPERWWPMTLNLYLTTVLSVGLLSALGGLIYLTAVRRLFPQSSEWVRLAAALSFGLGTLWLPYSTLLFEHVPVGALSLASFALIHAATAGSSDGRSRAATALFGAGALAGVLVILNYSLVLTVTCLGAYAFWRCRPRRQVFWYVAGGIGPAVLLGLYHYACFGDAFANVREFQLGIFKTRDSLLGVLGAPRVSTLVELLVLPYRGLFFSSPVLVLAVYGLARMLGQRRLRAEAILIGAVGALYLLLNVCFNYWHGGNAFGPRYLMPAIPFLALALVPAFARLRWIAAPLAAVSVAMMLLVTAVGPLVDLRVRNPLADFYLPLAVGKTVRVGGYQLRGPVSANPLGVAGGKLEVQYPDTRYARWNSFNLGETWKAGRWASLAPLALAWGVVGMLCLRQRRENRPETRR